MRNVATLGWDIGGAHLKAVLILDGQAIDAIQLPCPLWQGLDRLEQAVDTIQQRYAGRALRHALTMTGELADLFPDRAQGVQAIVTSLARLLQGQQLQVYAGPLGMLTVEAAGQHWSAIASANWHASATCLASRCPQGIFVDIGSTTSDLIRLHQGKPVTLGYSDAERLATQELVYTGVVRTPVMAVADQAPWADRWCGLAAEHFATMADVYRLTGELPEAGDMAPAADGGEKSVTASARRLARMVGADLEEAGLAAWQQLAGYFKSAQLGKLEAALWRLCSGMPDTAPVTLIGAGTGRFLVPQLASRLGLPYVDAEQLVDADPACRDWVVTCLPAYAVAWLVERKNAC